MLKTCCLTAAIIALGVAPALAQSQRPAEPSSATPGAPNAAEAGAPAAAVVAAPAVGVVVDPDARTAVVVPINPQAGEPPEVVAILKALSATGQVKPGQIVQVVVRHGDRVTEVISNAPIPY